MTRADIINLLAAQIGAQDYLEIGVQTGSTFRAVKIPNKIGVDPDPMTCATYHMPSDLFFSLNDQQFDIIFVDGLHHWETALRDIYNSMDILKEGGVVIVDDLAPKIEAHQTRQPTNIHWTGDVWKSWFEAVHTLGEGYEMFVIDVAFGVGIIRKGHTEIPPDRADPSTLKWQDYLSKRDDYLKIISWEDFERQETVPALRLHG